MNTKSQILSIAADLLQRQSIHGFSLQNVADQIGIRKASLFHHYRNKDTLLADVMQASINALQQRINESSHLSALRQLDAFFSLYQHSIGAGHRLCPAGGLLGDWDHIDGQLREQARTLLALQYNWLSVIALKGGYVQTPESAEDWAEQTLQSIQGSLLLSRIQNSPLPLERATARIRNNLAKEHCV